MVILPQDPDPGPGPLLAGVPPVRVLLPGARNLIWAREKLRAGQAELLMRVF